MLRGFTFHHVGVAVPDLESAAAFYKDAFGFRLVSGPFEDPIQKVKVCFLAGADSNVAPLELIAPINDTRASSSLLPLTRTYP